jgi:molybdate transport system ATP-binding protein
MSLRAELEVDRGADGVHAIFEVGDGETLAIVGPNGAGKTTVLGALAGVVPLVNGHVELDGRRIDMLPPERREVGLCFQDAALFPTMSVLENVAFPLRARRTAARAARERARAILADLAPDVDVDARPGRLSGGERQRVGLARALAASPRLLLLDEPLAAVDVGARATLRRVIRDAIAGFEGPCVLVAHDPVDALTMADRVLVLEGGRITQVGTPEEVRREPAGAYAADLVGVNLFEGTLTPDPDGAARLVTADGALVVPWPDDLERRSIDGVLATVRPVEVSLHRQRPEGSARNVFEGRVAEVAVHGDRARVRLDTSPPITAEITLGSVDRLGLVVGAAAFASVKAVEIRLRIEGHDPDTLGG